MLQFEVIVMVIGLRPETNLLDNHFGSMRLNPYCSGFCPNTSERLRPTKEFFLSLLGGNANVTFVAVFTFGGPSTLIGFAVSQTILTPLT